MKEKIALFGAGKRLKRGIVSLDYTYDIVCIYDNSVEKYDTNYIFTTHDGSKKSVEVRNFEKDEIIADVTYVITPIKWEGIYNQLREKGVKKIRLMCNYFERNSGYKNELAEYVWRDIIKLKMDKAKCEEEEMLCWDIWDNHYVKPFIVEDLEELVTIDKKNCILDYGCGCGSLVLNMRTSGFSNVSGVEIDRIKYDYCQEKIEEMQYPREWMSCISMYDGENIPFESGSFDIVVSDMVIEHVKSIKESLMEMLRVLKTGGYLYIHTPNYNFDLEPHYRIKFGKSLRDNKEEFHKYIVDLGLDTDLYESLNFVGPQDILAICEELNGLEVTDNSTEEVLRVLIKKL